MDCTPPQYQVAEQVLEARNSIITTVEAPVVKCIDWILGIRDKLLWKHAILIAKTWVFICTPTDCQAVSADFIERYKHILKSNKV